MIKVPLSKVKDNFSEFIFFSAGGESYQHCLFSKVEWTTLRFCSPIRASQESFLPLLLLFDVASFCNYV